MIAIRFGLTRYGLIAACLLILGMSMPATHAQAPAVQGASQRQVPDFVQLVKRHGAAVVNINASRTVRNDMGGLPFSEGDPFFEFFKRFGQPSMPEEYQAFGVGSGFIISGDGYVLTNAHVVADTDEVTVKLTDKREFKAKVLGSDVYTDIALLKIDAGNLPQVTTGNPMALEPGEWVAAIGAPFGFENSVTAGIVSAKGRILPNESYVPFLQTDVAVNPGNSGGPLFNMRGEVVGINSIIYSRTGGFMGVSFAIPIDIAMEVAQQLRTTGKVTRSRIGVQVQEVTRDLAASFGLQEPRGALIAMVEKGSPADKAKLQSGDVVLALNGQSIQSSADLARLVAGIKPGTTVTMDAWRNGRPMQVRVTTEEMAAQTAAKAGGQDSARVASRAGLTVSDIPLKQRQSLKIDGGVLVHNAEGAAMRAGMRPGDLVLRVNNTDVRDAEQFESLLSQNKGRVVALLVRRGANTMFMTLPVSGDAATQKD